MEFDANDIDGNVAHLVPDSTYCVDTKISVTLKGETNFESAPDDDEDDERSERGKAFTYAKHFGEGRDAEARFAEACKRQGWQPVSTSKFDDCVRRIDCVMQTQRGFLLVDVKGAKRLRRSDPQPQFRYHWLELHATGSLFSGESSVMALEVATGQFALFDKKRVREWIQRRLKGAVPVAAPTQALFRPYKRQGKTKEWITLVDMREMMSICEGIV